MNFKSHGTNDQAIEWPTKLVRTYYYTLVYLHVYNIPTITHDSGGAQLMLMVYI